MLGQYPAKTIPHGGPGSVSEADLDRFAPISTDSVETWLTDLGRDNYNAMLAAIFPRGGATATEYYGFLFYERYKQPPPNWEWEMANPIASYDSFFGPPPAAPAYTAPPTVIPTAAVKEAAPFVAPSVTPVARPTPEAAPLPMPVPVERVAVTAPPPTDKKKWLLWGGVALLGFFILKKTGYL
jgi:hypothetical protein